MVTKLLRDSLRLYPKDLSRYRTAYAGIAVLGLWCVSYFMIWTPTFVLIGDSGVHVPEWEATRICAYLWATMTAMGIVLTGGLFSDWLVLRLQTKKELTIGQMFTWRIMPLVFSPVLNLLFIGSVYLSIYYEPAKPIVDSLMPLAKIVVVGPVIPMMWCIVRGIAFSSVIPGKRGSAAILLSMLIILPAAGCAMSVYISIIEAYVGQAPFFL